MMDKHSILLACSLSVQSRKQGPPFFSELIPKQGHNLRILFEIINSDWLAS